MQSQISTSFLHHGSRANDCLPITVLSIVTAPSVTRPLMTAPSIICQASTVREQMSAHHSPSIKSQGRLSSRCHSPTRKSYRPNPSIKYPGHPSRLIDRSSDKSFTYHKNYRPNPSITACQIGVTHRTNHQSQPVKLVLLTAGKVAASEHTRRCKGSITPFNTH